MVCSLENIEKRVEIQEAELIATAEKVDMANTTSNKLENVLKNCVFDIKNAEALIHTMNQNVKTNSSPTFVKVNTGQGATEVHLMNQNVRTSDNVTFVTVAATDVNTTSLRIGGLSTLAMSGTALTINSDVEITGELRATSKSFLIDHPTKPNMKLQYGNLEGPEHGVYVRGKVSAEGLIELPDYWTGLVDEDTITVQLTPIGLPTQHYVTSVSDNQIEVSAEGVVNAYYIIHAERKDLYKLKVEFPA